MINWLLISIVLEDLIHEVMTTNLSQTSGEYELAPTLITSQPTNQVRYLLFV